MKKLSTQLIICLFTYLLIILVPVTTIHAQSPTKSKASPTPKVTDTEAPTPTPESDTLLEKLKQIKILKDKIATKVAEIRNKEKGGMAGIVKSVDTDSITLAGQEGNRVIQYSDDTTFYTLSDGNKTESTVKKVREGDMVTAIGYFGENNNTLSAKYVYIPSSLRHIIGKIADIDKDNYAITVKEKQGNQIVDIETSTRIFTYGADKTKQRGGFSKLKTGDLVHIIATPNAKDTQRVSGSKIFVLPPFAAAANEPEPTSATTPTKSPKATLPPVTLTPTKAVKASPTP